MRLSSVPYSQNITFNNLSSSLSCNQILSDINLVNQNGVSSAIYGHIKNDMRIVNNILTIKRKKKVQ